MNKASAKNDMLHCQVDRLISNFALALVDLDW